MPRDMREFNPLDHAITFFFAVMLVAAIAAADDEAEASDQAESDDPLPPAAGNSLTLANSVVPGVKFELIGSGLTKDSNGVPNGGMVTHVKLTEKSTGKVNSLELISPVSATDLVDAIEAGSGPVTAANYNAFYQLMYGSNLTGTGSRQADTFDGTIGAGAFGDTISGKGGKDTLKINDGNDSFDGGKGSDTADASWLKVAVNANLAKNSVTHAGGTTSLNSVENVIGSKKGDVIVGNAKRNKLDGGKGKDNIKGQGGNDLIEGGKGNDTLNGGKGKDKFLFHKKDGTDKVVKFQDGQDKLVLKGFGFKNKKQALKQFYEIGGKNDDKVGFDHKGTKIIIKGADLKDIDGSDILI